MLYKRLRNYVFPGNFCLLKRLPMGNTSFKPFSHSVNKQRVKSYATLPNSKHRQANTIRLSHSKGQDPIKFVRDDSSYPLRSKLLFWPRARRVYFGFFFQFLRSIFFVFVGLQVDGRLYKCQCNHFKCIRKKSTCRVAAQKLCILSCEFGFVYYC